MKNNFLYLLLPFLFVACHPGHHGVLQKKIDNALNGTSEMRVGQIDPNLLDGVTFEKSQLKSNINFNVKTHITELDQKQCIECHKSKKSALKDITKHSEIILKHADSEVMSCKTCHNEKNVWNLNTLKKKEVSMNHPYKVCQQCHFEQVKDWSNGAHGKRVGGWHGKKVRYNCTDCHNPHDPSFKSRWPSINPNHSKWKK
jgi:nitrate/TMAO reductase-like tetraheme cytochrome c subunit